MHAGPHGALHAQRIDHATNAVEQAMQDVPATKVPFKGDVQKAMSKVLPILEDLFDMPDMGPAKGSEQWLEITKANVHEAEYMDIVQHDALLPAFINYMQRIGDETGAVRLIPGEEIPKRTYKMQKLVNRGPVEKPRSLSGHLKLRYVAKDDVRILR